MRSIVRGVSFAGALCVLAVAAQTAGAGLAGVALAADGVLLVTKTTVDSGAPTTNQVQIESKRMRAESSGARGEKMIVMFDGTKQVMTLIDNEKKTYSEMTKADVEAMGNQMSSMMAQMEDQLKNLPPEQRAKIEAMMKGRGGPPRLHRNCSTRRSAPAPSASGRATGTKATPTARRNPKSAPWIQKRWGSAPPISRFRASSPRSSRR